MPLKGEVKRKYDREWVANRRANFFNSKKCVECSSVKNLQLDHIDPRTKISNSIWSWSEIRRNEEIKKCQILCDICHKIKTKKSYEKEFCKRNHKYSVVGKYFMKNGTCLGCKQCIKDRVYTRRFNLSNSVTGNTLSFELRNSTSES